MSATITMVLTVPSSTATNRSKLRLLPGRSPDSFEHLGAYLQAIAGGAYSGSAVVTLQGDAAVTFHNG